MFRMAAARKLAWIDGPRFQGWDAANALGCSRLLVIRKFELQQKHVDKKTFISVSREAVQTAEDAREISVKRMEAERIDAEAGAAADREANAKAQTISAEADTANPLRAREEAERQKREAQASALQQQQTAQAEAERNRADAAAAAANSEYSRGTPNACRDILYSEMP